MKRFEIIIRSYAASLENLSLNETITTCRFNKGCSEIKAIQITSKIEISLEEQLKLVNNRIKYLEKYIHTLNDTNKTLLINNELLQTKYDKNYNLRVLTIEEKKLWKKCSGMDL